MFSDASFQNLPDGGSQGGHIIFLADEKLSRCHILSWSSKKVRRVVKSTLAAKTLALQDGLDDAFFIQMLFERVINKRYQIIAFTDSLSLYNAIYSSKTVEEKRLRVDISSIQEMISERLVKSVHWIESCNLRIVSRRERQTPTF